MLTVVFSGSFDPIHIGHAMVANYVSQLPDVREVWLMPSPLNPLKAGSTPENETARLEMCRLVAQRCNNVEACDLELSMPRPSYTYETLSRLKTDYPDREFALLIGSDNWLCFDKWRNHDRILAEFRLLIYPRPGYEICADTLPPNAKLLDRAPQALISSTFIREELANQKNVSFFLPREVISYIEKEKLYGRTHD